MLNIYDKQSMEKYSSAVTLSDMEIFIFPELMYSLVLANIMSPVIWQWREDPWFDNLKKLSEYRQILRLKQFIMNNFDFNLDLDTWGLTTKPDEMERFRDFVDADTLKQSNALFGYEGDKYYFDIDIRRHFGLDKYTSEVIPYWKTETVEAMTSFWRREGYTKGAGECVSLSTLYYAALFIMAGIPTGRVFMIATPLHSQNFVDINDGLLTNNRRLVTHNMWFNGTELSNKAKRALVNEKVTFVSNSRGYVHRIYDETTLDPELYSDFRRRLEDFLTSEVSYEILVNFLREFNQWQRCFQVEHQRFGRILYLPMEKVFQYEHSSSYRAGTNTEDKLLEGIEEDEFYRNPMEGRLSLSTLKDIFDSHSFTLETLKSDPETLIRLLNRHCEKAQSILQDLLHFCQTEPLLPSMEEKHFVPVSTDLTLDGLESREDIIRYLRTIRNTDETAGLAFMAYREIEGDSWYPFMKAVLERNPVSLDTLGSLEDADLYEQLLKMSNQSIYSENRLATPDEVCNFSTGDGLEKALVMLNVLNHRQPDPDFHLENKDGKVTLIHNSQEYNFHTEKECLVPENLSKTLQKLGIRGSSKKSKC